MKLLFVIPVIGLVFLISSLPLEKCPHPSILVPLQANDRPKSEAFRIRYHLFRWNRCLCFREVMKLF